MRYLTTVLIALLFTSCQHRNFTEIRHRADTSIVFSSSAINIKPDTVWIDALLKCDSVGQVYIAEIEQLVGHNARLNMALDSIGRLRQQVIYSHDTIFLPTKYMSTTSCCEAKIAPKPRKPVILALLLSISLVVLVIIAVTRRRL